MPKIAFVFPGQGSQSLNLLSTLAAHFPEIEDTFTEASQILGYDLWQLTKQGPRAKINQTIYTQPIVFTASIALWRLWCAQSDSLPNFLAGHSLGEYAAYTCAGSLEFEETLKLIAKRGLYMQEAVLDQGGAMAVIVGLNFLKITQLCQAASHVGYVTVANYNTPVQVVVSGELKAVEQVIELAKQVGAKLARKIPVSVPAHCLLMKPAAMRLARDLTQISFLTPQIPTLNTTNIELIEDVTTIKNTLIAQLYSPVYWFESVQWLIAQGVDCVIECGPGQVLTHLIRQITPASITTMSIHKYEHFCQALAYAKQTKQ